MNYYYCIIRGSIFNCNQYFLKFSGVVLPQLAAKEKPAMHVVGDVGGRIAIMVDDMLGKSASCILLYLTTNENCCPIVLIIEGADQIFHFQMMYNLLSTHH